MPNESKLTKALKYLCWSSRESLINKKQRKSIFAPLTSHLNAFPRTNLTNIWRVPWVRSPQPSPHFWEVLINTLSCFPLIFSSTVSYEEQAISYVWKNDEDTLRKSPSLTTLNAYLIKNATDVCDVKGNWRGAMRTGSSCMRKFKRKLVSKQNRIRAFFEIFLKIIRNFILKTFSRLTLFLTRNFRKLFMFKSRADIHPRSSFLLHNCLHPRNHSCDIIFYYVLARMERCARKVNYHAER